MTLLDESRVRAGAELVMPPRQEISGPGVYPDMPDGVYHGDPAPSADGGSISRSGAMHLLPPNTPAHFDRWRTQGDPPKDEYDFGHAAHTLVLGRGPAIEVVDADDWRTKAAREAKVAARAAGMVPLLPHQRDAAHAMAQAVREHPLAGPLLHPDRGRPEVSMFWRHPRTGRWCRARADFLPHAWAGRRFVIADYKTTDKLADVDSVGKSAAQHGYHVQDAFLCAGVRALGIHPDPEFVLVVQEKTPPYLINVVQLDDPARALGVRRYEQAVTLFDRYTTAGHWPGYGDVVNLAELPRWATYGEDL